MDARWLCARSCHLIRGKVRDEEERKELGGEERRDEEKSECIATLYMRKLYVEQTIHDDQHHDWWAGERCDRSQGQSCPVRQVVAELPFFELGWLRSTCV